MWCPDPCGYPADGDAAYWCPDPCWWLDGPVDGYRCPNPCDPLVESAIIYRCPDPCELAPTSADGKDPDAPVWCPDPCQGSTDCPEVCPDTAIGAAPDGCAVPTSKRVDGATQRQTVSSRLAPAPRIDFDGHVHGSV